MYVHRYVHTHTQDGLELKIYRDYWSAPLYLALNEAELRNIILGFGKMMKMEWGLFC